MSKYAELLQVKRGLLGNHEISRSCSPAKLTELMPEIKGNCDLLKEIGDSLQTATELDAFVANCQEEIVRSFLAADLRNLYNGDYFKKGLTHTKMLENLKLVIGVQTEEQMKKAARSKFEGLTRRTDIQESFLQYLGRLEA